MIVMYQLIFVLFCVSQCLVRALPTDMYLNCGTVKPIFEMKNLSEKILETAVNGNSLSVCKAEHSCCSLEMESQLMSLVKKEYQSMLRHNAQTVQGILASTAIYFQDYVHQMLLKAEKKTLQVFVSVFGTISAATEEVVKSFFTDLNQYINNGTDIDKINLNKSLPDSRPSENKLALITGSFFVHIFPLIYETSLMEKQTLHPEYRACLQKRMNHIKPFSDITKMLEKDISKTLHATKVLIMSLNFGSQVLNQSNVLALSESAFNNKQCYEALLKMTHCSYCSGHSKKPCAGYCTNVMRGCLAQQSSEMDASWSGFYEAVDKLISMVNRGQSLVCLEDLMGSLHSRIAEPILYFSEQNPSIHSMTKVICGQVRWVNTTTNGSGEKLINDQTDTFGPVPGVFVKTKLPGNHPEWNQDKEDLNFRSALLTKKIAQFKDSVPKSRGFYASLADSLCADDSFAEKNETAMCWNGERVAEYTKPVLPIALTSQKYNPELPWMSQIATDSKVTDLVEKLRYMKQLVLSQIVTNPESDSQYQNNEYGSGSGLSPGSAGSWNDDEDVEPDWQYSGSGEGLSVTDLPDNANSDINMAEKSKTKTVGDINLTPADNKNQIYVKPGSGNQLECSTVLVVICTLNYWFLL